MPPSSVISFVILLHRAIQYSQRSRDGATTSVEPPCVMGDDGDDERFHFAASMPSVNCFCLWLFRLNEQIGLRVGVADALARDLKIPIINLNADELAAEAEATPVVPEP